MGVIQVMQKKHPPRRQKFDAFLEEEGLLEHATAVAMKRVIAWELAELMKRQRVTKVEMARRMGTSRAALDRLLDPENASVTLQTMGRAAAVLGHRLDMKLVKAA